MDVAVWLEQILLTGLMLMAGVMKLTRSKESLQTKMAWVEDFTPGQIRQIGALEVLGALGLVLPTALGILPWLTPVAAFLLALLMLGAVATHVKRKEPGQAVIPLLLAGMAIFVAYGRWNLMPF